MTQLILIMSLAITQPPSALAPILPSCHVQASSVVGRSSSGIVQVSNLDLLYLEARVRPRPFPSSGTQVGLRAEVTVSQVDATGTRKIVASSVNNIGGGGDPVSENVEFTLDIPLDSSERDAAIREYLAAVTAAAASLPDAKDRALALRLQALAGPDGRGVQALAQTFRQHRVGRFEVLCRVLDQGRAIDAGRANLEVLYKGRFFDQDAFRIK